MDHPAGVAFADPKTQATAVIERYHELSHPGYKDIMNFLIKALLASEL